MINLIDRLEVKTFESAKRPKKKLSPTIITCFNGRLKKVFSFKNRKHAREFLQQRKSARLQGISKLYLKK